jgi:DNA-binding transcriptional regulator YhcF (GntR family)
LLPLGRNQDIDHAMIKIEILSFFLANPHTRDTVRGFSTRLFMNNKLVSEAMQELVEVGIIEKSGQDDKAIYRLKVSYSTLEEYLA